MRRPDAWAARSRPALVAGNRVLYGQVPEDGAPLLREDVELLTGAVERDLKVGDDAVALLLAVVLDVPLTTGAVVDLPQGAGLSLRDQLTGEPRGPHELGERAYMPDVPAVPPDHPRPEDVLPNVWVVDYVVCAAALHVDPRELSVLDLLVYEGSQLG